MSTIFSCKVHPNRSHFRWICKA